MIIIIIMMKFFLLLSFDNISFHTKMWGGFISGRASVLLSEGCWFNSPGLRVEVSLGKILNPKTAPDFAGQHLAWQPLPSVCECMNYCKSLWTKAPAKCCEWKCTAAFCWHSSYRKTEVHKTCLRIINVLNRPNFRFVFFQWARWRKGAKAEREIRTVIWFLPQRDCMWERV